VRDAGAIVPVNTRTEITVETERILVIRRRYRAIEAWCDECAEVVVMIRPDQGAEGFDRSLSATFGNLAAAHLHVREQPGGAWFICLNSLMNSQEKEG